MIRRWYSGALAAALAFAALSVAMPLRAAIETDPAALYATMRKAFDDGTAKNWPFASELYYESTVFDAGRAYSLFNSGDPQYAEIAAVAVDVATQLRYDPLVNDDAALWYVLEAAKYELANGDDAHRLEAQALQAKLAPLDGNPAALAAAAESDALGNARAFNGDPDALAALVVTDVRAYELTHDDAYRGALLQHASDPRAPLERVPDPEYGRMFEIAQAALDAPGFTDADRVAARAIAYRRAHTPDLQLIARVSAIPHELKMTRTAPADEYFGNQKYSPIGVRNELNRINAYLDKGWGGRMESDAMQVDSAVLDWQRQYPHDYTLPRALLEAYKLLERVDTPVTRGAAAGVKFVLVVQYANSSQAADLEGS